MKLILDVENTVTKKDGKMHLDPFEPSNKLVMVGYLKENGDYKLYSLDTGEPNDIQETLDKTTCLIGHNIAYDLMWLWECGFKYDKDVFDTMLGEYILQRGIKQPLHLKDCAERYNLDTKKEDTLKEYFAKGYATDEIPRDELSKYLKADLFATRDLYQSITSRLRKDKNKPLLNTVNLTNDVCVVLAKIYRNGFSVDLDKLDDVKKQFENEKTEVENRLNKQVRHLMGDTPINLNSPEQMSWVIYSRKPVDKAMWANNFTPYMPETQYKDTVKTYSKIIRKTKAVKCSVCNGEGYIRKVKKDGSLYARTSRCTNCDTNGYLFNDTGDVAGLKFVAPNAKWVSANGFTINKTYLDTLRSVARKNNMEDAEVFLTDLQRLSALDTYLSSFVDGIRMYTKPDGKLHVRLLQHRTATGRFSGADPNMQNMPRGGTFPVKRVFVSRWDGGKILEADFAQLEFRTAAYLSQDKTAIEEIENGFDVHSYTAKVITEGGQKISRQEAKAHTFAPLYGATGFGRTTAEATYYRQFTEKYEGIALWHARLAEEALKTGMITTPSGRQFSFPDVQRRRAGGVSHFTQIKNYPVQSFATADVVPLILVHIYKALDKHMSCVVNTVHDSIVIDVHPNEVNIVLNIIRETNKQMTSLINNMFDINFNLPLLLEAKIGDNWLDTKDVV